MALNVPGRRLEAPYGRDLFTGKAGSISQQAFDTDGGRKLVWKQTIVQLRPGQPGGLEGDVYCSPDYRAELVSVSRPHRLSFLSDAVLTSSTFQSADADGEIPQDKVAPVFKSLRPRSCQARNVHLLVCLSDDNLGFFGYASPEGILLVLQQDTDPIQLALKALSPTKYASLVEALCAFTESEYSHSPPPAVIMSLYAQVRDFLAEIFSRPLDTIKEKVDFMLDALRALERDRTRQLLVYEDAALVLNSVEALLLPFLDFGGQAQGDFSFLGPNQPYMILRGDYMVYSLSDVELLPEAALAPCTDEDLPEASAPPSVSMTRPRNLKRYVTTPVDGPDGLQNLVEYCRFIVSHSIPYVTQIPYAFSFMQPAVTVKEGEEPRPLFYELSERREEFDIRSFCRLAVQERIKRSPFRVYDLVVRTPTEEELGLKTPAPEKPPQGFLDQAEKALKEVMAQRAQRAQKERAAEPAQATAATADASGAEAGPEVEDAPAKPEAPREDEVEHPDVTPARQSPDAPAIDTDAPVPAREAPHDSLFCATLAVMPAKTSVVDFDIGSIFGSGASDVLLEAHYGRLMLSGSSVMVPGHYAIPNLVSTSPTGETPADPAPGPGGVKLDIVAMSPLLQGKNVSVMLFGMPKE